MPAHLKFVLLRLNAARSYMAFMLASGKELPATRQETYTGTCMNALVSLALLLQTAQQIQSADADFRAGYAAMTQGDLAQAHAAFAKVVVLTPKVAAGHSAYGAVLLAEGNAANAVRELELAHRLDPKEETATLNLATAYSREARYVDAVAMFRLLPNEAILTSEAAIAYATALAKTGDLRSAAERLGMEVARKPTDSALRDALGTVLAQQKQYEEAKTQFERAIALDNDLPSAHLHLGSLYLMEQDVPRALAELLIAVKLEPDDLPSLLQLGRAQVAAREDELALATLTHARELVPASVDVSYALALALQNAGRNKEALPLFAAAAAARPQDGTVLTNYALALVQTGDARQAEDFYRRALALDASSPVLREDLGVAYLQQSDLDNAIVQFKEGLALPNEGAPITAELHYDLGLALKLKDKLPEATAEFERAQKADPALPDPPFTLGILYMQTGRFAEAAAELEHVTVMQPGNGEAWSNLGNIYKQMEQPEKAVGALRRAIKLLPAQPSPHITLAAILAQQGDREGAAAERKKGAELSRIAIDRQRAEFALRSGTTLLQEGKLADALAQMRDAVAADPGYAAAHYGLADVLARRGDAGEAAVERQKGKEIDLKSR